MRHLRGWICGLWCMIGVVSAYAAEIGDSMEAVQSQHGRPIGRMSSGNRTTWLYPGFTVLFVDGKVAQDAPSARAPEAAATRAAPPPSTEPTVRDRADGFRWETLFDAVDEDDLADVRKHLAAGEDVNVRHPGGGETPLHVAASWASPQMVELLLDEGADINARATIEDEEITDATPLHLAVLENKRANIRLLLQRGADVRAGARIYDPAGEGDGRDISALHMAASEGRTDLVRILLEADAPINATMSIWLTDGSFELYHATPLHMAAFYGHANVVRLLLDHGANINARTRDGATPLALAEQTGEHVVMRLLRTRGGTQ